MMPSDFLNQEITYLKGVGPQRALILSKELEIKTYKDLIEHYPFRYVDRSKFYKIAELSDSFPYIQVRGTLVSLVIKGEKKKQVMVGKLKDETGILELVWFAGLKYLKEHFQLNQSYIAFGKPSSFNGNISISHPEMELAQGATNTMATTLMPVYSTTEKSKFAKIDSKTLLKLEHTLVAQLPNNLAETLCANIINDENLISRRDALYHIHKPANAEILIKAQERLKFEELFFLQLKILYQRSLTNLKYKGQVYSRVGNYFNQFFKEHLPFPLTNAQKRVIKEIRNDCATGRQMNRLLQGDVGSGKTLVALMSMLISLDNGCQNCMMAPTEILAHQHYQTVKELLKDLPVEVALLTGSIKGKARKQILDSLADGCIHILIGTHAVIEDEVIFKNLGFVVIDEQHRFGVAQRAKLWKKNNLRPHVLVMTATPIPRTLSMTLYGDLDVSVMDELPPGRKPIKTLVRFDKSRLEVFGFIKSQIKIGHQIYIVYPLIAESEKVDLANLEEGYQEIIHHFPEPEFKVSVVHGKMHHADKEREMNRFIKGNTQLMVATSVIEVGVNIPNANVIVIENAERFGLAQLHQLRGRVGRGAEHSFCILMAGNKLSHIAKQRLKAMVESNDGFKLAELDLTLRGPGDMEGTQQSGILNLKLADLAKDQNILIRARAAAIRTLELDPDLSKEENKLMRNHFFETYKIKTVWSAIS
ncbi:MAG: hypothetical protein RIQ89_1123 [Bacteroidota bacterium]|jgi:ATP-dependent DNA helicase RecG